jgi:two-component system response regulator DevR
VTVRIVVADDSDAFRAAVRDVLAAAPGVEIVAEAATGADALAAVDEQLPDVVVLDVEMPGGGPSLASQLRSRQPATRLLCLTARDDRETVLSMLAAGATGYVAKGALDDDLATCIRRCADGMLFVIAGCAEEVRARITELVGPTGQSA